MRPSRRELLAAVAAPLFALAYPRPAGAAAAAAAASGCRAVAHEGAGYAVCAWNLSRFAVRLFLRGPDGAPYGSLGALSRAPEGRGLLMAMNAGMYHPDLSPVGLYVENGRELVRANNAAGPGNFHMKPNGVFFIEGGRAGILETGAFLRRRLRPDLATQSGPMLVIDGRLHPRFSDEGPSRKIRNGVGVREGGREVVFAISDEPVSFGAFARLFRDELGCRDALFLDGSICGLYAPGLGRSDVSLKPIGPIVGVVAR